MIKLDVRLFLSCIILLVLYGCDILSGQTFLGTVEKPPLPGKRISILAHDQT